MKGCCQRTIPIVEESHYSYETNDFSNRLIIKVFS
jgi:hypothetical protein